MTCSRTLVNSFDTLICSEFKLQRSGNFWRIQEPEAGNSLFEIGGCQSTAFSLDQKGQNVFPFFTFETQGIRQVNDALVVAQVDDKFYVVAIEMKTSTGESKALRQIESGRFFIEWAVSVLRFVKACSDDYIFFGVVSFKPRNQPRKSGSRRSAELPIPSVSPHGSYPVFRLRNHPRTSIIDLVRKLPTT